MSAGRLLKSPAKNYPGIIRLTISMAASNRKLLLNLASLLTDLNLAQQGSLLTKALPDMIPV